MTKPIKKEDAKRMAASTFAAVTVASLDALSKRRENWEATEFKKANDVLYTLLADCYALYEQRVVAAENADKKAVRADLAKHLKEMKVRVQFNTTTLMMMVRFVFGSDRKRAHGYAYVIKAALSHGIGSKQMPDWIKAQGGIEEIKRNAVESDDALLRREQREQALDRVREGAELAAISPVGTVQFDKDVVLGEHAVLVVRPAGDGTATVLAVLKTAEDAVVEVIYKRIAKADLIEEKEKETLAMEAAVSKPSKVVASKAQPAKKVTAKAGVINVSSKPMAKKKTLSKQELLAA